MAKVTEISEPFQHSLSRDEREFLGDPLQTSRKFAAAIPRDEPIRSPPLVATAISTPASSPLAPGQKLFRPLGPAPTDRSHRIAVGQPGERLRPRFGHRPGPPPFVFCFPAAYIGGWKLLCSTERLAKHTSGRKPTF
jgi:hypothetical protein